MSLPLRSPLDCVSFERALEDLLVRFIINVPPEDLATIERALFHFEEAHWFYTDFIKLTNPHLPNLKIKTFASYVISLCPLIWKWQDVNPDEALQKFSKYKKSIPVRGAAIFNENLNKILLVKGMESESWSFPRGKISKDEDDVHCCIREVMEEIGFDLTNYIDEDQYIERNIGGKNYKIYLVKGVPQDFKFKPQVRNEIEKIEWRDFWRLSKSIYKSNTKYYLLNSMVKPLSLWVKKQKQVQTEEQLKQYAEEQLKLLLGIGSHEESADPGRELLNMLQSSVGQKEHMQLIDDESQTSMSTSAPATVVSPSTATSQIPVAANAFGGAIFPFTPTIMAGSHAFNPFPFVHGFPQGMFPQATFGLISQPQQILHAAPQLSQRTQPVTSVSQPPQTPIVKPTMLEETEQSSKQLLDLLKNPKKSETVSEESSAKILLKILKTNPKEKPNDVRGSETSSVNMTTTNQNGSSETEQKSSTTIMRNANINQEAPVISRQTSLQEKASHDHSSDEYEVFEDYCEDKKDDEKTSEEDKDKLVPEEVNKEERYESVIQPAFVNSDESRSKNIQGIIPSVDRISLDNVSHVNYNNDRSSTTSSQTEKSKGKPKFKLLKRGEKITAYVKPTTSPSIEGDSFISKDGFDAYQKGPESQQSVASGNDLLAILKDSRGPNNQHSLPSNSAKELLSILQKPNVGPYGNPLFAVSQRTDDGEEPLKTKNTNKKEESHELLQLLKRPHVNSEQANSSMTTPTTVVSNISTDNVSHLPFVNLSPQRRSPLQQQPQHFTTSISMRKEDKEDVQTIQQTFSTSAEPTGVISTDKLELLEMLNRK
ncbi:HCL437Wp [Eremothecium sinecaudum]|uniref:HCL437Wp n=1 Tax=Eremothecium sinecaudum TaxID=45286 RepID=A0A120K1T2_9SACH|nr:HCL437Wp [Eremothecium sinecaudum]AMD19714.1 HCL437Wp [Eremothecium sinecaudum]